MRQLELVGFSNLLSKKKTNPMLKWGKGPEGAKCKDCQCLTVNYKSKAYYKCKHRGITNGKATDHLVNWPACLKYEE